MADDYVERVAGELADLALADERRSDDNTIVDQIGEIVGASSQTLQEAFLTAVRVRRAERRARQLLADRAADQMTNATPLPTPEKSEEAPADDQLAKTEPETTQSTSDDQPTDVDDVMEQIDNLIQPRRPDRR
ncbi:MAG: hypothetical protein AAFQ09_08295 [Pseudomonadota bacterium]